MKHHHRKGSRATTQGARKNLALRVSLVDFTPDEVDLLLEVIALLSQVGNDPRSQSCMPLVHEIGSRTAKTQQKLQAIREQLGKTVIFDHNDYRVLYTATLLFGQIHHIMPVLLPPPLAAPGVAQRVQAVEAKLVSTFPPVQNAERRK